MQRIRYRLPNVLPLALALSLSPCGAQETLVSGAFEIGGETGSLYIGDQHNPEAIAFGDGFLVLWDDRFDGREDIFARRMGADGEWLGAGRTTVSAAAGVQKRPAVVEVGGRALAVWEDDRNGLEGGSRDLYANFIEADGSVEDARGFLLIPSISDKSDIELAASGDVVLAVWEDRATRLAQPVILAMRFAPDGSPIDDAPALVGSGVEPVVSASPDGFMLVYQALSTELQALVVQLISADVSEDPLIGESSLLHAGRVDEPTIAWDGEQYSVAWIKERSGSSESYLFARIADDLTLLDDPPLDLGYINEDGEIDLVADERGYLVVANTGIVCTAIAVTPGEGGSLELGQPISLSERRNRVQDPSAAIAGDGTILVTWEDEIWEFGGNDSGFGENLFHCVGDLVGGFTRPRAMVSAIGEFPAPRAAGTALVRSEDGIGVLWRTALSEHTSGSIFYTRTGAGEEWGGEPALIGSDEGAGVWAVEADGRTICYWTSSYWLRMLDVAAIETGDWASFIYTPLDPGSQTEIASDGEDVYVLSTVPTQTGSVQPVLSVLGDGEVVIASSPVASFGSNLGGLAADNERALAIYLNGAWVGRRARLLPGNTLEFEAEEIAIPQGSAPLNPGFLTQKAIASGPDGVEIVWAGNGNRLQHLWIPWGFGEPVTSRELDLRGYAPSLHRDGDVTTLVVTGFVSDPMQQMVSWTGQDPSTSTRAQRIDLDQSVSGAPAVLDSSGRLVYVDRDRQAGFISDIDPLGVDHVELMGDGTARIGLSGPAFGVFDLDGASDLRGWEPTGLPPVTIAGDGRASFTGVDADTARFWRGVYRTK